jgi:cytoskeletal protein RodZ
MTVGKAAGLTAAFIAVFAVGLALGPSVKNRLSDGKSTAAQPATAATETAPASVPTHTRASTPRARTTTRTTSAARTSASTPAAPDATIAASEPRLHDRLRPVLNRGARMDVAAEGFQSAEQFATIAHAARNTNVPFMVLKHRVLNEARTLADAIREAKPNLDAKTEVERARVAARSDVAAITG